MGGLPYRQTACDIALLETTDKRDTRLAGVGRGILRQVRLACRFARRRTKYPRPGRKQLSSVTKRLKISLYGYGGLIQWSNHQGVSRVFREPKDTTGLQAVIFNPRLVEPVTQYDLLFYNAC
ncbi:hypothetical protein ACFLVX_01945 [Chloroflexota bacterium]